ncbi:MAG: 30S ribosome-binding factor RbfA [Gemmatimonadota bacterium]
MKKREAGRRPEQVSETVRQVVAEALGREIRDPRVGFVTVTSVQVSGDLSHAKIFISVMGDDAEKSRAMEGLRSAAGFLRTRLTRALSTRTVPELHFEIDRGLEHAARINALLADMRHEDQD